MILNRAGLDAVRTGFNTAFNRGIGRAESTYKRVATRIPSSTKEQKYGFLGKFPKIREWLGPRAVQNLSEHDYAIKEKKFESTIAVDRDEIETDNIGIYAPMFEEMGQSSDEFPDELTWGLLLAGWATPCYDGQNFFDTDHPVLDEDGNTISVANTDGGAGAAWFLMDDSRALKPVIFQERKPFKFVAKDKDTDDNVFDNNENIYGVDARCNVGFGFWQYCWGSKQTLDAAHYEVARTALMGMKTDFGRPINAKPRLLVVGPSNEKKGLAIIKAANLANGETNVYQGTAELLVVPWLG